MASTRKRRWLWACLIVAFALTAGAFAARKLLGRLEGGELAQLRVDWSEARENLFDTRRAAKSDAERQAAQDEFAAKQQQFVQRCRAYATAHAGTAAEIRALKMIACQVPESPEGKQALAALVGHSNTASLADLTEGLRFPVGVSDDAVGGLAPALLARAKKAPDDPGAALLLASVVCGLAARGPTTRTPPREFQEAADLIAEHYADRPDIENFCETVAMLSPNHSWTGDFEKHLRTILEQNHNRKVRVAASFALASVVQATGEKRQLEAQQLYQEFVDQYDGSVHYTDDGKWYPYAGVEEQLNRAARKQIMELSERSLGKPAPEIVGIDLEGKPMKLSDFRGKVVLLSFWQTSCGPCLKFAPRERALLDRFGSKSFTVVGVNSDEDPQLAQKTAREHGMTWPCFRDNLGPGRAITSDWQNIGFPMLYVIDQKGIIKRRWLGAPLQEDLSDVIAQLCGESTKEASN